jgi:quinol-cytochrome oxidoreductase complex cytochrome b subunit
VTWLWGGFSVDSPTLNRFYALHYLLPFLIFGVVFVHLWALHTVKSNNPLGVEPKTKNDTIPFHPYYTAKDFFGFGVFFVVYLGFVFFAPNFFGEPDNYIPANPLLTPPHIVPEWYFLPYYAILRSVPDKLLGVIAMFGSILILFVLPWLDRSPVKSGKFRPVFKQMFWLFVVDCIVLGWVGKNSPDAMFYNVPFLMIGRVATAYYFGHFLVLLPLIAAIEKPGPLPESISAAEKKD